MIKKETIKIDKDFLTSVLKAVDDLKKEVNLLKQTKPQPEMPLVKNIIPEQDYIFQCLELQSVDRNPPLPQDIISANERSKEFRKQVEILMKTYKVIQFTGSFLKKI